MADLLDLPLPAEPIEELVDDVEMEEEIPVPAGFHVPTFQMDSDTEPLSQESAAVLAAALAIEQQRDSRGEDPLQRADPWSASLRLLADARQSDRAGVNSPLVPTSGPIATAPSPGSAASGSLAKTLFPSPGCTASGSLASANTGMEGGNTNRRPAATRPEAQAHRPKASISKVRVNGPVANGSSGSQRAGGRGTGSASAAEPAKATGAPPAQVPLAATAAAPSANAVWPAPLGTAAGSSAPRSDASSSAYSSTDAPTMADMLTLFEDFQRKTQATVSESQTVLARNLQGEVHGLLTKFQTAVQTEFQQQHSEIRELKSMWNDTEDDRQRIWTELNRINAKLATVDSAPAAAQAMREEAFDADPDPTKIRVNTQELIDKAALSEGIAGWLLEADLGDHYELLGPDHGIAKNWVVQLQGAEGLAARRVRKALDLLRGADGEWRQLQATSPLGRPINLYVSKDKNQKQMATERLSKKLFTILKELSCLRGKKMHLLKREGMVCVAWKPLARIEPEASGAYTLFWNASKVAEHGVNKAEVVESLAAASGGGADGVEWSR